MHSGTELDSRLRNESMQREGMCRQWFFTFNFHHQSIFAIHLAAKDKFANKLVCGCGWEKALKPWYRPVNDSECHLPCPKDGNIVNISQLLTNGQVNKLVRGNKKNPWPNFVIYSGRCFKDHGVSIDQQFLPRRPEGKAGPEGRLMGVSGGGLFDASSSNNKRRKGARRMPKDHQTCGSGLGLYSVYELSGGSSPPRSLLWSCPLIGATLFVTMANRFLF